MQRLLFPVLAALCGPLAVCAQSADPDARDAIIKDLQRRVQALEEQLKQRAPPTGERPAPAERRREERPGTTAAIEDEESTRALERTLTRQGGLVLPAGSYEVEPKVEYSYRGTDTLAITTVNGQGQVANQVFRRHRGEASLGLSVGLPRDSQVDIRVPYGLVREERATGTLRQAGEDRGLGDVDLTFTKQLQAEQGARPGLLASVNWKTRTGAFSLNGASVGTGFQSLQGALTAVKRQDPLVFFGTLSYTSAFGRRYDGMDIDPGNSLGLRAGAILAASPKTSLRAGFEFVRSGMTRIDGSQVPGTDPMAGTLQFGVAALLTRKALLDLQLGVGVTRDAPDFRISAALPIRFD